MSDSKSLRVKRRVQGNAAYLRLTGTIDESFQPSSVFFDLPTSMLFIDLNGIHRLSSFGVREWTRAMRDVCQRVENVYWMRCSPAIVVQLNFVANFAANARILSMQAPYYCESCGHETELTCELEIPADFTPPSVKCDNCGEPMELDEDPNTYFSTSIENAQNHPVSPNLSLRLSDLLDEDQMEGSIPSISSGPRSSSINTGIGDIPTPSITPRPMTMTGSVSVRNMPRDNTRMRLKAIGLGVAIPIIVGLVVLLALPSRDLSDELPDSVRDEFTASVDSGDFEKAVTLLRALQSKGSVPLEVLEGLKKQVAKSALADFQGHIDAGRFAEAGRLVMSTAQNRVISRREAERYQRQIVGTVLARHRDFLVKERFDDEADLVNELFQAGVLPASIRTQFERDVVADRKEAAKKKIEEMNAHYRARKWKEALQTATLVQRLIQPNAETRFIVAESHRALGHSEEAAIYYQQFVNTASDMKPPHEGLDDALLFLARRQFDAGQKKTAKRMLIRLLNIPNTPLKSDAEAMLAEISASRSRRPARPQP